MIKLDVQYNILIKHNHDSSTYEYQVVVIKRRSDRYETQLLNVKHHLAMVSHWHPSQNDVKSWVSMYHLKKHGSALLFATLKREKNSPANSKSSYKKPIKANVCFRCWQVKDKEHDYKVDCQKP